MKARTCGSSLKHRKFIAQKFFLAIYKPTTPGPRTAPTPPAAAIIVWPRPGRAICSARRAAPLPPRARLGAVPKAHPPSPLCMRQHRRLLGCRRGRKTQESELRALRRFQPQTEGEEAERATKNQSLINKKPTPGPPPSSAHHRVPAFPSHFHIIPVLPALSSIPLLSLRLRAETAPFSKKPEEGSRKPLWWGREAEGESISPSPPSSSWSPASQRAARRTISELQPCIFNLASICLHPAGQHCSISH